MGRGMSDLESSQVDLRASVAIVAWSHRLCDVLEARETKRCSKGVLTMRHAMLVRKSERHAGAMSSRGLIVGMKEEEEEEEEEGRKEGSSCGYDEVQYFQVARRWGGLGIGD